ncbi:amino acid kinase family protein [Candidatus Frankia nodulisporulans]|uniref:amino acid kinase family protein n=1 Tax=Candidatus Frankia nodulisporulans TaxID=2060052 RepID=UPI0013CF852A|nr:hypothetical protein [Candidatus Frankia nodulisporulans]
MALTTELTAASDLGDESASAEALVLKFGGAAFAAPGAHRRIATYIAERLRTGGPAAFDDTTGDPAGTSGRRRAVVVVSAVAGETDRLSNAVRAVSPDPDRELLAAALMTGETVNVAVMTAALRDAGLTALPLGPADTGLLGAGEPHSAELRAIDPSALTARLAGQPAGTVLVVPGGQALDATGHPVMLGRNSSDLSAIAAAIALGTPACEIFSDSPGICTADPRLVPTARTLATVDHDTMITMSRHGAKVLHHSAVDWARRHQVEIHCRSLLPEGRVHSIVGTAATSAAAVLVHTHGAVWTGAASLVHDLCAELTAQGSDAVVVQPDRSSLVLADTVRDLRGRGLRPCPELRLVTTLFLDGRLEHRLVTAEDAPAVARAAHDAVFRPSPLATAGAPPPAP